MEYWKLLQRPEWQKKRLEVLDASGWSCVECGSSENSLHVHHKQYFKDRNPWEYENEQLEVLCDKCHTVQHQSIQNIKEIISLSNVNEIYNLLVGYSDVETIKKLTPSETYDNYCADHQASGVVAKLLQFVPHTNYKKIAEFLVENACVHLKDDAENFFRQNFPVEISDD